MEITHSRSLITLYQYRSLQDRNIHLEDMEITHSRSRITLYQYRSLQDGNIHLEDGCSTFSQALLKIHRTTRSYVQVISNISLKICRLNTENKLGTESTRNLPERKADNLIAICEPVV
jgi:hypothetical protein